MYKRQVLTLDAIKEIQGGWLGERKIMSGKPTLMESYTTDKAYSVCKVDAVSYTHLDVYKRQGYWKGDEPWNGSDAWNGSSKTCLLYTSRCV